MRRRRTWGRQPCPCGTKRKYKDCCRGRVAWPEIVANQDLEARIRNLSARGKNLLFLQHIGGALQLDRLRVDDIEEFKRAFTPAAVQQIFRAVYAMWYDGRDLERVLRQGSDTTSGLYVGTYEPLTILRCITRHSSLALFGSYPPD